MSWPEAHESCKSSNTNPSSTLAAVHDSTTNDFLSALAGGSEASWIGGYQDDSETWYWADGSNWSGYNNWAVGQPDNTDGIEDFLGLNYGGTGLWNDWNDANLASLCQYDPSISSAVLITGGVMASGLDTAEIYNPSKNIGCYLPRLVDVGDRK